MSWKRRQPNQGLFPGFWTDLTGKKLRRVRRGEYPELYRLHRLCTEVVGTDPLPALRYYRIPQGYLRVEWPGIPRLIKDDDRL